MYLKKYGRNFGKTGSNLVQLLNFDNNSIQKWLQIIDCIRVGVGEFLVGEPNLAEIHSLTLKFHKIFYVF